MQADDSLRAWELAEQRRKASDVAGARQAYEAVLALEPGHVPALLRLSDMLDRQGHYRSAHEVVLRADAARPRQPMLVFELCERLRRFVEIERYVACASAPHLLACRHPGVQAALGTGLSHLGQLDAGRRLLQAAIAAVGRDPPLLYSLAKLEEFAGHLDLAAGLFREVLAANPDDAYARRSLAKLPARHGLPGDLPAAQAHYGRITAGTREAAVLDLALFTLLDRGDDTAGAWPHLVRANATLRALSPYDAAQHGRLFDALESAQWPAPASAARGDACPVFIVGLHRTGSTLLESLLGRHPDVAAGGELYDFPAQLRWALDAGFAGASHEDCVHALPGLDLAQVGERYLAATAWRRGGKRWLTDKLPMNFLNVGFIAAALPGARILHTVREPMDACFSNLKEPVWGAAEYSNDPLEMAAYFARYHRLMEQWKQRFPGRILDVPYHALVTDTVGTLRQARQFCGLPDSADRPGAVAPVTTASSAQVRDTVNQRGLGAWRRYASGLEPMRQALVASGCLSPVTAQATP